MFERTIEKAPMCRQSVVYIFQFFGFVIDLKKLMLTPFQEIEFLGMIINSREVTLSLPKAKNVKYKRDGLQYFHEPKKSSSGVDKTFSHLTQRFRQYFLPGYSARNCSRNK